MQTDVATTTKNGNSIGPKNSRPRHSTGRLPKATALDVPERRKHTDVRYNAEKCPSINISSWLAGTLATPLLLWLDCANAALSPQESSPSKGYPEIVDPFNLSNPNPTFRSTRQGMAGRGWAGPSEVGCGGARLGEAGCGGAGLREAGRAVPGQEYGRAARSGSTRKLVESKTRKDHGRVGSGRTAGWRGEFGQDWMPTELFAQETSLPRTAQSTEETSLERFSRSTNERNPI